MGANNDPAYTSHTHFGSGDITFNQANYNTMQANGRNFIHVTQIWLICTNHFICATCYASLLFLLTHFWYYRDIRCHLSSVRFLFFTASHWISEANRWNCQLAFLQRFSSATLPCAYMRPPVRPWRALLTLLQGTCPEMSCYETLPASLNSRTNNEFIAPLIHHDRWNHQDILDENPTLGSVLTAEPITVLRRTLGSSSTSLATAYIGESCPSTW